MLHRHGARYPTSSEGPVALSKKIRDYTSGRSNAPFKGSLEFLNTWTYKLGAEILVPIGKQELFDSGTFHQV